MPMRKMPPSGLTNHPLRADEDLWMALDNDPKHHSWLTRVATKRFLKKNRIEMVKSPQLDVDGNQDICQNK